MPNPRIALAWRNDQWEAPCGCAFHYWDGRPRYIVEDAEGTPVRRLAGAGEYDELEVGRRNPHLHLCPKHQKEASRAGRS